jgi:sulfate permease, SulP family
MKDPSAPTSRPRPTTRELVARYAPITAWLPAYPRAWLGQDIAAGITSWAVMVPVAMAYAELAGVAAGIGLVTATAGLVAYSVLGTSRHVKVTTSSTMAIMSASVVAPAAGGDEATYLAMTAMLALIVGLYLLAAGVLRLGFLSEFLAKPVITGFIVGLAITIAVGQLPKLLGVPKTSGNVVDQLLGLVGELPETDVAGLGLGLAAIVIIVVLRRIDRRIPGPLIAVAGAIVIASVLDLADRGVAVVGDISGGIPGPGLPHVGLGDLAYLATGAAGIFFLALAESVAAARAFANRHGYRIEPDQELVALGGANLGSGLMGGFTVDASVGSMATAEAAGVRTQVSSLLVAALLLLTLLFLGPLFANLPQSILAAVIITAVISLVDFAEWRRYVRWRRTDAFLALVAALGVLLTDVLIGLVVAALLSVLILLYSASQPTIAILGRLRTGHHNFVDVERNADAAPVEGLLILRLDTPLYYFNATAVSDRVLRMVDAADDLPRAVLLDIEATIELDVTTSDALYELVGALEDRGTRLVVVHAKGAVRDRMDRVGLVRRLGPEGMYRTETIAVAALAMSESRPPDAVGLGHEALAHGRVEEVSEEVAHDRGHGQRQDGPDDPGQSEAESDEHEHAGASEVDHLALQVGHQDRALDVEGDEVEDAHDDHDLDP